jgi:hypothetical protein
MTQELAAYNGIFGMRDSACRMPSFRGVVLKLTQNQVVETSCWFESGQGHQGNFADLSLVSEAYRAS